MKAICMMLEKEKILENREMLDKRIPEKMMLEQEKIMQRRKTAEKRLPKKVMHDRLTLP